MMFLGLLIVGVLVYFLLTDRDNRFSRPVNTGSTKAAETILDERFAKGEIDEATYIKMKETLKL